jgi:hypothetical protein
VTRFAEHHLGAGRPPFGCVAGEVVAADVGLGLDDPPATLFAIDAVHEDRPNQIMREHFRLARVERAGEFFQFDSAL